jgi:biuret amidohydrolase
MSWKNAYRSFYYENAGELGDVVLDRKSVALLVIDMQNKFVKRPPKEIFGLAEQVEWDRWTPFYERIQNNVVPNISKVLTYFRQHRMEVIFAKIACLTQDGRDRSLSQKKPGWNCDVLPIDSKEAEVIDELSPLQDEIVLCKTTDSALTGTNLRLILNNIGIKKVIVVGIVTDQCISSTVRSLADESYEVVVLEDCCTAATNELHDWELKIINNIYCNVMSSSDVIQILDHG